MPYPRGSHRLSGGRNYRRVQETRQNDATGTGSGSSGGGGAPALTYAQTVLADNPVGYWKFNESSGTTITNYGSAGATKNLTTSGSPTLGVAGPVAGNTGCTFVAASTQYATVTDAGSLFQPSDVFTVEFWFKKASNGSAFSIVTKDSSSGSLKIGFASNNKLTSTKAGVADLDTTTAITDTASWHHAVYTKDGSTRVWYVDGVSDTTLGTNQTFSTSGNDFWISRRGTGLTEYMNGGLAQIAVYSTALSGARVAAHYAARNS